MKRILSAILMILLLVTVAQSATIAEDDFNRADNTSLGPKWGEEAAHSHYEIKDNQLFFRNESHNAVINQDIALSQGNYTLKFTYYDKDPTATNTRLMINFYIQSYTTRAESMVIQLRESNSYALAYWGNGSYISDTGNIGVDMNDNTEYEFRLTDSNISIYQNGSYLGYLDEWGDLWSGGTVGFSSDTVDESIAIDNFVVTADGDAPNITSHTPTSLSPEVYDSQEFTIQVSKMAVCEWYVNGSLAETDTENTEHQYTNESLQGGGCNVTVIVSDIFGNDTHAWLFEVGADSADWLVLVDSPTTTALIAEWDILRVGSNATVGLWQNSTFDEWNYTLRTGAGAFIARQVASADNDSLWWDLPATTQRYRITAVKPTQPPSGSESFVNPTLIAAGGAGILFIAAGGRKVVSSWRNRRRKRRN